jgi:hypothetical protein
MDHADLPNAEEAKRVRVENAQRVSGEVQVPGAAFFKVKAEPAALKSIVFTGPPSE